MSFCSKVKDEITGVYPERECCKKALLNGAFAFFNTVGKDKIKMNTESEGVAQYITELIKELFSEISITDIKKKGNKKEFTVEITDEKDIGVLAKQLGLINRKTGQISGVIDGNLSVNSCCQRATVKGAFLAAGSVTDPKSNYHFEISCHRKTPVNDLKEILLSKGFNPGIIKRGADYVLYIKEKEAVADMLNLIGSKDMFFEFHDTLVMKEMKNQLNRKQNFEQANLDKTVAASVDQRNAINNIIKYNKFDELPENLKEIAVLRLENPEASLSELSGMLKEPITRSGINHRLKKLYEIGKTLEGK